MQEWMIWTMVFGPIVLAWFIGRAAGKRGYVVTQQDRDRLRTQEQRFFEWSNYIKNNASYSRGPNGEHRVYNTNPKD